MAETKLKSIEIKNFRAIGSKSVKIDLDDIVILVGPNNSGKSSILRAYEIVMQDGSDECQLTIEDFPNHDLTSINKPEIILSTIVDPEDLPSDKWVMDYDGEYIVQEIWRWENVGKPKRYGYLVKDERWATDEDKEKVPWGAANVSKSRRPQPHKIDAFDPPEVQSKAIIGLIDEALDKKIKSIIKDKGEESPFRKLIESVKVIQKSVVEESAEVISGFEQKLSKELGGVFPNYTVKYDAKPEQDIESSISFFKADANLYVGPKTGHLSSIENQGSGAKRTILWAALKMLAEEGYKVKSLKTKTKTEKCDSSRPNVLLIDEPEICLHPSAIRLACDVLYDLPKAGNWQVIATSHSPIMIDYTRDNTTIVRVERNDDGGVEGSTLFRPSKASLGNDDKENLKLLNMCDPYLSEFFFGGKPLIVEGDTEYAAFSYVISQEKEGYDDIQILRARGKATIVSLCKILNQFKKPYSVLHDTDLKTCVRKKDNQTITNPAWSTNKNILDIVKKSESDVKLVASVDTFETAYFDKRLSSEKPYSSILKIKESRDNYEKIKGLLDYLIGKSSVLPSGAITYDSMDELEEKFDASAS
ncbi:AAA family ATPase [Vibrio fluvialis]|nr:AAA family ATPase [Vibrio fluvialis]